MQKNDNYKIISLGSNCFPRRILTENGLKPSKEEGELSLPFDLCVTPIASLIEILQTNFEYYLKEFKYNNDLNAWFNKKYGIYYNHDTDCSIDEKNKLIERFSKRINNFRKVTNEAQYIYFTIASDCKFNQTDINTLYNVLSEIKDKNSFTLVIFDFFNSNLKQTEGIEIISIPHPYHNFTEAWWNDRYRYSEEGKLFEEAVITLYADIVNKKHTLIRYKGKEEEFRKKQIFINFVDFPHPYLQSRRFTPYSNIFTDILSKHYKVIISNKPDFLFYSVFGNDFEKYENCTKIFYTDEVIAPNFNQCDYAMGYDYIDFEGRYMRYPVYFQHFNENILDRSNITSDFAKRKFCNFIYSNASCGEGAKLRYEFCQKLSEYKQVDCPGKVLNNMKDAINAREGNFAEGKLKFQKNYKFTIAFENNLYPGYTTEKLSQAFLADTIPIYWGNPEVVRDFNPKAFINCHDYNSIDEVIQRVIELDNNDEEYLKMLREPCVNSNYEFNKQQMFEDFLLGIIEKGNKPFNKNPNPAINKYGYVGEIKTIKNDQKYLKYLKKEKNRLRIMKNITFGKKRKHYKEKYKDCKKLIGEIQE